MSLCEESTGLPCVEGGILDLDVPEGDAAIIGVLEPFDAKNNSGTVLTYTDPNGVTYDHEFTKHHQLVALADSSGNQAILIISDQLEFGGQGIKG